MKTIAAIQVDLERTPIGTRSRLARMLRGKPVLRRTVERVRACCEVSQTIVLCPVSQAGACKDLVAGMNTEVASIDGGDAPWAKLVRTARKWSLDGWRGGIGGATFYDEFVDCRVLSGLLRGIDADAVLCVPPAAPLFDPALADRLIRHKESIKDEFRLVFCQTPPGLSGLVLDAVLVRELAEANSPVGWAFGYQPDTPKKDLILESCCLEVPRDVRYAVGRVSVDTDRATETVEEILTWKPEANSEDVGRWLLNRRPEHTERLPKEVEVELTTDDPYPNARLRPRGRHVRPRGPIDPSIVARVVESLAAMDDTLLLLGGFGDPLRHPQFESILRSIRSAKGEGDGIFGLAVRTTGVDLTPEIIGAMIEYGVDVLDVILDAWSGDLYAHLQSPGDPSAASLDHVLAAVEKVNEIRAQHESPSPVVVPEFTKSRDNVHELDAFYDGWIRRTGTVMIGAATPFAGQFEDHRVLDMAPPSRSACRRIASRCLVLADGRVTACDQDFKGQMSFGCLADDSLRTLWQGAAFSELRKAHAEARVHTASLCQACTEWHRP